MSNDFKAFMLVMLVVFSLNYCTPNKIERDNKRLDFDYSESKERSLADELPYTTAVRG